MLALIELLPKFRYRPARGSFGAYLVSITRTCLRKARASQRRMISLDEAEPTLAGEAPTDTWPEARFASEWREAHLRNALRWIRRRHDARTLRIFEDLLRGHPLEHVCARYQTTLGAIQKSKQRIARELRSRVSFQILEEERRRAPPQRAARG